MDSRESRGLTAIPLRGSAERSHGSLGSMSVSSPRIRGTSCYACMTIRKRVGDAALRVARLGLRLRVDDQDGGAAAAV
ncbi:hypothetical protein CRG98_049953 [Punica granatum]|uniref:Uncharacterized protein n=1 Tax=Punica granatum TaxID=22663 RepID=A0A2I0H1G7_PUNGR|nr:hypothetical protein CRG98_049953 [Punica granatum]